MEPARPLFPWRLTLLGCGSHWSRHVPEGAALEAEWNAKFAEYENKYKEEAETLKGIISGELPAGWEKALPVSFNNGISSLPFRGHISIYMARCIYIYIYTWR